MFEEGNAGYKVKAKREKARETKLIRIQKSHYKRKGDKKGAKNQEIRENIIEIMCCIMTGFLYAVILVVFSDNRKCLPGKHSLFLHPNIGYYHLKIRYEGSFTRYKFMFPLSSEMARFILTV